MKERNIMRKITVNYDHRTFGSVNGCVRPVITYKLQLQRNF